jgi:hypothetical protein
MSDTTDAGLPIREPGENGPLVGGEHMPVPHAEPEPVPDPDAGQ